MTKTELIESIKARNSRTGIVTADRYFREVEGCFDGGFCPVKHVGAESGDQWSKALKEAEQKLTFQNRQMRVLSKSLKRSRSDEFIAEFDAVITTTRRDRDGDVLETKGAELDNDGPLLLHHMSMMPIGRGIKVIHHSHKVLKEKLGIADNDLGRDTLPLVKARVLRISHGFDPKEWEPMDDDNGWRFTEFMIFERSLVSVPSNIDAVVTDFTEKDFKTDIMRGWYDGMRKSVGRRKTSVVTVPADVEAVPETNQSKFNDIRVKEFDVERQHLEAAQLEYDWISRFCSCEVKQLVNFGTGCPRIKMGSFLTGLKYALADSNEVDTRRLTHRGTETPLEYETIQLNSEKSDHFLVDGISFRKLKEDGTCFAVKLVRGWGEQVEISCAKKDSEKVADILGAAWKWADENNFLKGEAFSLDGEFLPDSKETWGDLFLKDEIESEVKRTVDLLNAKGKACPNRGQVFMGPPGTGKTLSGRLIRNNADATFIWVAGKDAYYYGGVNAVVTAFEMAKELAPAIIFMEDIDASLDSRYAIDVLKTEMDGIGQSTGVVTIMTTNHPNKFPEALLDRPGRFHDVLKFDLPDDSTRLEMLEKWLPDLEGKPRLEAVKSTDGYSGAHLYELSQYAKNIGEQDELGISDAVLKALKKIDDQRELIDQELCRDRTMAGRLRDAAANPVKSTKSVTKSFVDEQKSLADIEREYIAELADCEDTDVLRKAHRRIGLMLRHAEDQEEAKELDELLSLFN